MEVTRDSFEQAFTSNGYKCPTYENYADFNLCIEKAGIKKYKRSRNIFSSCNS